MSLKNWLKDNKVLIEVTGATTEKRYKLGDENDKKHRTHYK